MLPPWRQFPNIPLGSLGWRMGRGEDYWWKFYHWYRRLSLEDRTAFARAHPEPEGWTGFYDRLEDWMKKPIQLGEA
jgi:hypothetical protein